MRYLLKAYFLYMKDPREGLNLLFTVRGYKVALLGYLMAALAAVCVFNAGAGLSVFAFLFKTLVWWAAELTIGLIMAACAALFLDFTGKKASAADLFILIGTAGFIKGLVIAFSVIALAVPALSFLVALSVLAALGLQLGYLLRNISRMWEVNRWQAFGAVFFCAVPALAGAVLSAVFFVWGMVVLL